mmetsp:Transcript_21466/g.26335  ORF Transcript_21466/g.26335 Transcript_21466/m.26335 type:complete len:500 (-) Transcript_21466:248-1747(-)
MVYTSKKNKAKNKKNNVINCLVPGLKNMMEIPFPVRKLPVCTKCKKIYKTRQLCRVRDGHTDLPWNTSYICFLLDDSCFIVDDEGNESLVQEDGPNPYKFVAKNTECSPVKYVADLAKCVGVKVNPICMPCKLKNYATSHCRLKHEHNHLPWGTIYINLTAEKIESAKPKKEEAEPENKEEAVPGMKRLASTVSDSDMESVASKRLKIDETMESVASFEPIDSTNSKYSIGAESNSIYNVSSSKAFLLVLKNNQSVLQWLKIDDLTKHAEDTMRGNFDKETSINGSRDNVFARKDKEFRSPDFGDLCRPLPADYQANPPQLESPDGYHGNVHSQYKSPSLDWSHHPHEQGSPPSENYSRQYDGYNHPPPPGPPTQAMTHNEYSYYYNDYGPPRMYDNGMQQHHFDYYSQHPQQHINDNHRYHGYPSRDERRDSHPSYEHYSHQSYAQNQHPYPRSPIGPPVTGLSISGPSIQHAEFYSNRSEYSSTPESSKPSSNHRMG